MLSGFVAHLHGASLTPGTVKSYLTAVWHAQITLRLGDSCSRDMPQLAVMLVGRGACGGGLQAGEMLAYVLTLGVPVACCPNLGWVHTSSQDFGLDEWWLGLPQAPSGLSGHSSLYSPKCRHGHMTRVGGASRSHVMDGKSHLVHVTGGPVS